MAKKLITANEIIQLTGISGDLDENNLNPCIKLAQDLQLSRILGSTLYDTIETQYPTFSGVYKTIYDDYVLPILAFWSVAYQVKMNFATINDSGNSKKTVEGATALDRSDNISLEKDYVECANSYELKFICFAKENTIPELQTDKPQTNIQTFY
jgi:hypothetical protein